MTRFGISAYEGLLTATRYAGVELGEPLGTIAPGQLADLILVEGDPLADIADAANAKIVIRDGVAFDVAALIAPFKLAQAEIEPSPISPLAAHDGNKYFWHDAAYLDGCRTACCADHQVAAA